MTKTRVTQTLGESRWLVLGLLLQVNLGAVAGRACGQVNVVDQPYVLDTGLLSRSISFENPTGAPGEGGQAASPLGVGRKGAPSRSIEPGETVQLCDIQGPGTIRHIWLTTAQEPAVQRACVIRVWWDGQEHPSIECPIGDLFGFAHGKITSMYRWHLPDAIAWQKEARITIQQIAWKNGLAETQDDWSCATFWYEPVPSAPLPALPDVQARTADIWTN